MKPLVTWWLVEKTTPPPCVYECLMILDHKVLLAANMSSELVVLVWRSIQMSPLEVASFVRSCELMLPLLGYVETQRCHLCRKSDASSFAVSLSVTVLLVDLVKSAIRSHVRQLVVLATTIHTFEVAGWGQHDWASSCHVHQCSTSSSGYSPVLAPQGQHWRSTINYIFFLFLANVLFIWLFHFVVSVKVAVHYLYVLSYLFWHFC